MGVKATTLAHWAQKVGGQLPTVARPAQQAPLPMTLYRGGKCRTQLVCCYGLHRLDASSRHEYRRRVDSGVLLYVGPVGPSWGWWRWAMLSPDGVAPIRMVGVSASVNLPLHHKVQKFSSGTDSLRRSRGCGGGGGWCV